MSSPNPADNPKVHTLPNPPASPDRLRELGLYTPNALDAVCAAESHQHWIIDELIFPGSVNTIIGDSGLGKSPLVYQMCICIAAGIPWLDLLTTSGKVVYFDLENGEIDSQQIRNDIVQHLELPKCPDNFLVYFGDGKAPLTALEAAIKEVRPALVIIDSLRTFQPAAERDNTAAASLLQQFRALARKYQTAILFIHHTRKPDEKNAPISLEACHSVIEWLNQGCGPKAFINQSDLRLGVEASRRNFLSEDDNAREEAALVIRWHRRVRGQSEPITLARCYDEGEPIGYRRLCGSQLLSPEHRTAWERLPLKFRFAEAKSIYGRQDSATVNMLDKCIALGVVVKTGKGRYEKVAARTLKCVE